MMTDMVKGNPVQPPETRGPEHRFRRKRVQAADRNHAFVRAFADALRDILQHERRRAA
jgi:hypothetical protein